MGSRLNELLSGVFALLLTVLQPVRGFRAGVWGRCALRRGGGDRFGAGQAARAGGPQASVHRFCHACSRWWPSGR